MNGHLGPDTGALPESVKIGAGQGGLPRLEIATPSATAEIYLHGAHVTRWQPSHAVAPVLWVSEHSLWQDGKPIRGGVPICFPWFGPHRSDPAAPAHGFARLVDWTLAGAVERDDQSVVVTFALEGAQMSTPWPFRFRADLRGGHRSHAVDEPRGRESRRKGIRRSKRRSTPTSPFQTSRT